MPDYQQFYKGHRRVICAFAVQRSTLVILSVCLLLLQLSVTSCSEDVSAPSTPLLLNVGGSTMGTSWTMSWVAQDSSSAVNEELMQAELDAELLRINALMSTWDPVSELSLFNKSERTEPVVLHRDTLHVIDAALQISRLTSGRYDITLGPVIELWGFGQSAPINSPNDKEISSALALSGFEHLVLESDTLQKSLPDMSVDLSSLAKGFAVDRLGEVAEAMGIKNYLADIGGELRARGSRADETSWRVGIENPQGEVPYALALSDTSIATSGSYRNYRMENGVRLSHIIDGLSGKPIEHQLVSVSVVHESTMLADAWATALLVVGFEDAQHLIRQQGLTAQLTRFRDGAFESTETKDFARLLIR